MKGNLKLLSLLTCSRQRDAGKTLNLCLRKRWISLGEGYLNTDYPALTASGYMEFCNIGDRAGYESGYFERRRMLYAPGNGRVYGGKRRDF